MPFRVAFASTRPVLIEGLIPLLRKHAVVVVGRAHSVDEAAARGGALPEVIVIDVHSEDFDGFEAARRIHQRSPRCRTILLIGDESLPAHETAWDNGVWAVVRRSDGAEKLANTIHRVSVGEIVWGSPYAAFDHPKLTPRESEMLEMIARGGSPKAVGEELGISPRTVEAHRKNIMNKLRLHDLAGLVRYAIHSRIITV